MKRIFSVDPWLIQSHELKPEDKRLQESITAIGNGYMGLRGNFEEGYSGDKLQGTYLGGVWFPDKTVVGWWKNGYPKYFGKVINAPSFIDMKLVVNGHKVDLAQDSYQNFSLTLDLHQGLLSRSFIYVGNDTKVRFTFRRFLSNVIKEAALIEVKADVLAGQATIKLDASLDGNVTNEDSNYGDRFWQPISEDGNEHTIQMVTKPNPYGVPRFTVLLKQHLRLNGVAYNGDVKTATGIISENWEDTLQAGQSVRIEKDVIVITSRDVVPDEQVERAAELMYELQAKSFTENLTEHTAVWGSRWSASDVVIDGDEAAQQGIRFNIAQLFMTYHGEDERLNVGPKGFTGEKYGGATYWDTEAYVVPMYLAVAQPQVTRGLLQYRHDQLPGAYHNARQQGLKGALFPMVTFNGIECHNEWEITFEEIHRNAAVAFAIYQYTAYTGDESYVNHDGIEVLVAISRFWADRVHYSQHQHKYMIHGVTGPNEYENNVNNNWYTNTMAAWVLQYTLARIPHADHDVMQGLAVTDEEQAYWRDIVDNMYFPEDKKLGIFLQNDTFLDKELRPASSIPEDERPINQHWSWDRILRSPFIKQADVLQGIYFLNDRFTLDQKERNYDFYEPLTVHESSLSASVHSILAAELGKQDKAVELYARTARLDLDNYNNDTTDGLHITSMTGSWLAIVQGFAGMRYDHNQLRFKPFIPHGWTHYSFKLNYRGRLLAVDVTAEKTQVELLSGDELDVELNGQIVHLERGDVHA